MHKKQDCYIQAKTRHNLVKNTVSELRCWKSLCSRCTLRSMLFNLSSIHTSMSVQRVLDRCQRLSRTEHRIGDQTRAGYLHAGQAALSNGVTYARGSSWEGIEEMRSQRRLLCTSHDMWGDALSTNSYYRHQSLDRSNSVEKTCVLVSSHNHNSVELTF